MRKFFRRIIELFEFGRCYCGLKLYWFESTCGSKECVEKYKREWQPFGL